MKKTKIQIIFGILRGLVLAALGGFVVLVVSLMCWLGMTPLYVAKVLKNSSIL